MGSGASGSSAKYKHILEQELSKPLDSSDIDPADAIDEVKRLRSLLHQHRGMVGVGDTGPNDITRKKTEALMAKLDTDASGEISAAELRAFVQKNDMGYTEEQVDAMFKVWDKDSSGTISTKEFQDLLTASQLTQAKVSVKIVIPSTSSVDVQGTEGELFNRRTEVMTFLAERFGGVTAKAAHLGAYRAFNGDVVYEQGILVETFATPEEWKTAAKSVRGEVQKWCKEWGQECMALTINGSMEFVMPPGEEDPEMLCKSLVTRIKRLDKLKCI